MHKFSTAMTKSFGVLHLPCDPQTGAPDPQAGAPEELQEYGREPPECGRHQLATTPLRDDSLKIIRVKGLTRVSLWTLDRGVIPQTVRSRVFARH